MTSAIQEANSHTYCTLALYQRDQDKVDKLCKVKVSNKIRLPVARYVSNGEWLVATEKGFNLRKHCVGEKESSIIPVVPPYTAVNLESGCRALADVIELPIYFKRRQEYHVLREGHIVSPPKNVKMTELTIWKPVATKKFGPCSEPEEAGGYTGQTNRGIGARFGDLGSGGKVSVSGQYNAVHAGVRHYSSYCHNSVRDLL